MLRNVAGSTSSGRMPEMPSDGESSRAATRSDSCADTTMMWVCGSGVPRRTRRTTVKPSTRGSERSTISNAGQPRRVISCTASSPSRTTIVSRRRLSLATCRNAAARVTFEMAIRTYGVEGGMSAIEHSLHTHENTSHVRVRRAPPKSACQVSLDVLISYTVSQNP